LIVLYISILALLQMGLDGSLLSEEIKYEWNLQNDVPRECREATKSEMGQESLLTEGKASTFNLKGFYRCERQIFEYGERHSFDTFVANHASERAIEVALKIAKLTSQHLDSGFSADVWPIKVDVASDSLAMGSYLQSVFEVALIQYAPRVTVLKQPLSVPYTKVRVVVRKLDDTKALFGVTMSKPRGLRQEWIEL